jgi:amino acid transporter
MGSVPTLRRDCLSPLESLAQSLGTMAPTATLGTVIPLLIGKSGNATWLLFLGILGVFLLIAASVGAFASRSGSAGSLATYVRLGLGPRAGIVAGWCYLIALTFCVASSAVSCAYYLDVLLLKFSGWSGGGTVRAVVVTGAVVAAAAWPAWRDVRLSTKLMLVAELVSVAVILLIVGTAMVRTGRWIDRPQLHLAGASLGRVRLGFVLAFMMLAGFESTTTLGEETRGATRWVPRVLLLCLLPTGALFLAVTYCLTDLGRVYSLALDQADVPFDVLAAAVGAPSLGWLSSFGVALSCYACALASLNAGSRVVYAMARDRLLPGPLAWIHRVNATPGRGVLVLAGVAGVVPAVLIARGLSLANGMDYLMQVASFGFIGGYLLVTLAAPCYLRRAGASWRGHAALSAVAFAVLAAVLALSVYPLPDPPVRYLPLSFAVLLLAGTAISAWVRRRASLPASASTSAA